MQRTSRKSKPADTRQFDLFAGAVSRPATMDGVVTVRPASEAPAELPYEAEVLDVLVGFLNRQWAGHLSSSAPTRSRPFR
jgi:hypothetical protein